jgi:hypothetical protein
MKKLTGEVKMDLESYNELLKELQAFRGMFSLKTYDSGTDRYVYLECNINGELIKYVKELLHNQYPEAELKNNIRFDTTIASYKIDKGEE